MSSSVDLNTVGVHSGRVWRWGWLLGFVWLFHEGVSVAVGLALEPDDPAVVDDAVYGSVR